jgi:hypothetical protein
MAGAETWYRILNAIERLQAKAPAEGTGCIERRSRKHAQQREHRHRHRDNDQRHHGEHGRRYVLRKRMIRL